MNTSPSVNRREFLVRLTTFATGVWAFFGLPSWAASDLPAGKTALSESEQMAAALGYKHDAAKADASKYPQLKTPEGKKQRCDTCNFYTKENANWGKCTLLQAGLVNSKGWCASWIKKA